MNSFSRDEDIRIFQEHHLVGNTDLSSRLGGRRFAHKYLGFAYWPPMRTMRTTGRTDEEGEREDKTDLCAGVKRSKDSA